MSGSLVAWEQRGIAAASQSLRREFWKYGSTTWERTSSGQRYHVPPHAQTTTRTQSHAGADAFSRIAVAGGPECVLSQARIVCVNGACASSVCVCALRESVVFWRTE